MSVTKESSHSLELNFSFFLQWYGAQTGLIKEINVFFCWTSEGHEKLSCAAASGHPPKKKKKSPHGLESCLDLISMLMLNNE